MSCHVMSRHVTSCYIMSCYIMSCHVMSRHVMSRHVMSRHVTSRHVTSRHVMSCHVTSCHVMSRHITSCHVMLHHVMSCHVMSCRVMSGSWAFPGLVSRRRADGLHRHKYVHDGLHLVLLRGLCARQSAVPAHQPFQGMCMVDAWRFGSRGGGCSSSFVGLCELVWVGLG